MKNKNQHCSAKSIHLDKLRAAQAPILTALDVSFMRAVEAGDAAAQQEIAVKKQALRDDLAGIKATWPEVLK